MNPTVLFKNGRRGPVCRPVVELLPSLHKALVSISSAGRGDRDGEREGDR